MKDCCKNHLRGYFPVKPNPDDDGDFFDLTDEEQSYFKRLMHYFESLEDSPIL